MPLEVVLAPKFDHNGPIANVDGPMVHLGEVNVSPTFRVVIKLFDQVTLPNFAEMLPDWPGIPPVVRQPGFWVYMFLFISCEYGVSLVVNAGQPWWLEKLLVSVAWGGLLAYLPALLAQIIRKVWASQISAFIMPSAVSTLSETVGSLSLSCADQAPDGWLECNGQAVPRSKFTSLFAAIGDKFGKGDGTATFNLPDLQGRVAVSRGTQGTEQYNLGSHGGEAKHTLQLSEVPAHTHYVHDHGHTYHTEARAQRFTAHGEGSFGITCLNQHGEGSGEVSGPTHTSHSNIHLESTGGGQAHNNMPPYLVLSYFIKCQ